MEATLRQQMEDLTERERKGLDRLYQGLLQGQRACLAESITLVETQHPRKKVLAQILLQRVLAYRKQQEELKGGIPLAFRVGRWGFGY